MACLLASCLLPKGGGSILVLVNDQSLYNLVYECVAKMKTNGMWSNRVEGENHIILSIFVIGAVFFQPYSG